MSLDAIKKILLVLNASRWKYQWWWEDAWVILYRDVYIRCTLFSRPRIPSRNVFIEIRLHSIHCTLVIPIKVVHIRCAFQPKETMYVCGAPMLPLIPANMWKEILWGECTYREKNKKGEGLSGKNVHQNSFAWKPFCNTSLRKIVNWLWMYCTTRCGLLIIFLNFHQYISAESRGGVRNDHVHVIPFGVSCTKGEEESRATYLYDHISDFTSPFVPKQACPSKA